MDSFELIFVLFFLSFSKTLHCLPPDFSKIDDVTEKVVPLGRTAILTCKSNDEKHNFQYWHLVNTGVIIGPSNDFDDVKYKYEILSGNLTIRGVSKDEEGLYECVSRAVCGEDMNIRMIRMVVQTQIEDVYQDEYNLTLIKVLIGLIFAVLIAMGAYFLHGVWRDRFRFPRYLEEDDDDESTEELFSAPSTSRTGVNSHIVPKKTPTPPKFSDVDISTDFQSILDTANDDA